MKKLKPQVRNQIANIESQMQEISDNYETLHAFLVKRMNIDLQNPDVDSENWAEYTKWHDQALRNLTLRSDELWAKYAALLLIGHNIARRGKPLHEKTVLKKIRKLGDNGAAIRRGMYPVMFNPECGLYAELKKRGITLFDGNAYHMTMTQLDNLNDEKAHKDSQITKYEKHLQMFHQSVKDQYKYKIK